MTSPLVSVVIPTHDRPAAFLRAAIESALRQTWPHIEVIVIDDHSVPPVPGDIASDPRVRLDRCSARGLSAARNRGLELASGSWITFLDDDDVLLPHMVEASLQAASESRLAHPVATLSAMDKVDEQGKTTAIFRPVTLERGRAWFFEPCLPNESYTSPNTLFAPTAVIRSIGGFDEELRSYEWSDLLIRLNAVCSIQGFDQVTYEYRWHSGPHLSGKQGVAAAAMQRYLEKHAELFARHPFRRAGFQGAAGFRFLLAGHRLTALELTLKALLHSRRRKHVVWFCAALAGPTAVSLAQRARRGLGLRPGILTRG